MSPSPDQTLGHSAPWPHGPMTNGASSAPLVTARGPASSSPSAAFSASTLWLDLRVHPAAAGAALPGGARPQSGPVTRTYPPSSGQSRHGACDPQG